MTRLCVLLILLAFASAPLAAQDTTGGEKAYAPENLSKLDQPEQIRVLEKQYGELSGGRPLPEDQLEFYLEQIPRGWTYAQITQDMVQSLRDRVDGNTYPNNVPPAQITTPGWVTPLPPRGRTVLCESNDRDYRECATGFLNPPMLDRQLSSIRCVEGRTWGHRPGVVWVSNGCRGQFSEAAPAIGQLPEMTCQSIKGYRECNVAFRGPATLLRQLRGSSLCIEGRTWGQRPGLIWVDRGCAGVFAEAYRPSGGFFDPAQYNAYWVDCSSLDNRYAICSWDRRQGPPVLIEQYSSSPCIEGLSWGYTPRRGLWVDRGCRARFASRNQ